MNITLTDSRRLTGANLYWQHPSAIIDLCCESDPGEFIDRWKACAERLLEAVGRADEGLTWRTHAGGASLLISAPIDALYSMCELNEVAFSQAQNELAGETTTDFDEQVSRLNAEFRKEANPALLALQSTAREHEVPFLWDDDEVSVGYGRTAQVWPVTALPDPETINWSSVDRIPVAMVTGTNGKSTTVRMAAAMMAAGGIRAGLTSTDWIRVGKETLDTGDYSGTGGARILMRHPETQMAVLETARGGLLRRGLGLESVSAALITNVAADHLGDYGINTVPELIEAKFIVRKALQGDAPLVLNADDAGIVDFARQLDQPITWFSLDPENPLIRQARGTSGKAAVLMNDELTLTEGQHNTPVIAVNEMPASLGGAARYNIQNALGAVALCAELGVSVDAMREGLAGFHGDENDNPGRSNWFEKDGVRILVDFAHNEHGMLALAEMLSRVPSKRRAVLLSQAGDRTDKDIADMTAAACGMHPDRLLVCDLPGYERGREAGEVPRVIRQAALDSGIKSEAIEDFANPREAVDSALRDAREGDLLVLLILTQRDKVLAMIHDFLGDRTSEEGH